MKSTCMLGPGAESGTPNWWNQKSETFLLNITCHLWQQIGGPSWVLATRQDWSPSTLLRDKLKSKKSWLALKYSVPNFFCQNCHSLSIIFFKMRFLYPYYCAWILLEYCLLSRMLYCYIRPHRLDLHHIYVPMFRYEKNANSALQIQCLDLDPRSRVKFKAKR